MKSETKEVKENKEAFQEIGYLFRLPGEIKKVFLIKDGSVATTYRIDYDTKKSYLFQKVKVNKEEFVNVMDNVEQMISYAKKYGYSLIHFHHTNTKDNYVEYNGEYWRVKRYFEEIHKFDSSDPASLNELGYFIGVFQYLGRKFDVAKLHDVYPNIHNLRKFIEESDNEYVRSVKEKALLVTEAYEKGLIPTRITHNDTKIKTAIVHKTPRFYINIDLARPGIGLYDFASVALLNCATTCFGEASDTKLDLDKFKAYLTGYIGVMGTYLSKTEKELIAASLFAIAVENIVINKDREQKKQWCLSMAKDIESNADAIKALVKEAVETTKKVKVNINESSIDRDLQPGGEYKVGQYMNIHIPHFVKPKGGKAYAFFKRLFDIFCSLLAILVLSPLMLIIGLLVVCTSKGPMIYVSKRVGKNGKIFNFYKFRSMYKDAEQRLNELLDQNEIEGGVTFKMKNDPRITPFGRFIRKTSIDELPQLFNILKGDMSIIGPRAALPREIELYPEEALDRLSVPQGLSGEWQANGRSDTTFDNMIRMDLDYIQNKRGFWHDIGLVFKTLWVVIRGSGAE